MTKDEALALDLALEALEPFSTPNWAGAGVDKVNAAIAAIRKARSAPVQEPVAHCEAGPAYCQQCHLEDRSLALAAAVRYVKNNTPKLVSDEICMALSTPPAQPAPVQEPVGEKEISAWAERHDIQGTPTDLRSMFEDAASFTAPPAAREWVGLTDEDKLTVRRMPWETLGDLMDNTEAKLKEKNNGGSKPRESP
jgi:hypothetical protein